MNIKIILQGILIGLVCFDTIITFNLLVSIKGYRDEARSVRIEKSEQIIKGLDEKLEEFNKTIARMEIENRLFKYDIEGDDY